MQLVIKDIIVNYKIYEGTKKNTLLILHGWGRSMAEWHTFSNSVSPKYRVIVLDMPGFGYSSIPKSAYSVFDYADFVDEFLRKLNIDSCVILGHSFGGRLGVVLPTKHNYVKKLILVDSAGILEKSLIKTGKIFLYKSLRKLVKPIFPKKLVYKIKSKIGSADYMSSTELKDTFVKIVNQDLSAYVKEIKIPTLIIWGNQDDVLSVSQAKIFKKNIPNSRLRIVWGAKHSPHLEKPQEFTELIEEFLHV